MKGSLQSAMLLVALLFLAIGIIECGAMEEAGLPGMNFYSQNGSCAGGNTSIANISLWNGKVMFNGSVTTANPCYDLKAEMDYTVYSGNGHQNEITVTIDAISGLETGGGCIECIGEVLFSGEIGPLDYGEYNVSIVYEKGTVAQQLIERRVPEFVDGIPEECYVVIKPVNGVYLCGNRVMVWAEVLLSSSCAYIQDVELTAPSGKGYPQAISLEITTASRPGACMQVVSQAGVQGEIRNLDPGEYEISVVWKWRTSESDFERHILAQQTVVIE